MTEAKLAYSDSAIIDGKLVKHGAPPAPRCGTLVRIGETRASGHLPLPPASWVAGAALVLLLVGLVLLRPSRKERA